MATHQEIANISDEELVDRMITTHDDRFDGAFWSFFDEFVDPHLGNCPQILDVGCGPGLYFCLPAWRLIQVFPGVLAVKHLDW